MPMLKCNLNKVALLHIFKRSFSKNTSEGLLISLPDEEMKDIKVDILLGFQSR